MYKKLVISSALQTLYVSLDELFFSSLACKIIKLVLYQYLEHFQKKHALSNKYCWNSVG